MNESGSAKSAEMAGGYNVRCRFCDHAMRDGYSNVLRLLVVAAVLSADRGRIKTDSKNCYRPRRRILGERNVQEVCRQERPKRQKTEEVYARQDGSETSSFGCVEDDQTICPSSRRV